MNRVSGVHLSGADLARPAKDLPFTILSGLGHCLHQHLGTGNWEMLAEELGYDTANIKAFSSMANIQRDLTPGEIMLRNWRERGPGRTIFVLCKTLEKLGRFDCVEYLKTEIYNKLLCVDLNVCVTHQSGEITLQSIRTRANLSLSESLENALECGLDKYSLLDRGVTWNSLARKFKGCQLNLKCRDQTVSSPLGFRNQMCDMPTCPGLRETVASSFPMNNLNRVGELCPAETGSQLFPIQSSQPVPTGSSITNIRNGEICLGNNIQCPDDSSGTINCDQHVHSCTCIKQQNTSTLVNPLNNKPNQLYSLPVQEENVSSMTDWDTLTSVTQVKQPVVAAVEFTNSLTSTSSSSSCNMLDSSSESDKEWTCVKYSEQNRRAGFSRKENMLSLDKRQPRDTCNNHVQFDCSLTEVKQIEDTFGGADSTTEFVDEIEFINDSVPMNSSSILDMNDVDLNLSNISVQASPSNIRNEGGLVNKNTSDTVNIGEETLSPRPELGTYPYMTLQPQRSCPADLVYSQQDLYGVLDSRYERGAKKEGGAMKEGGAKKEGGSTCFDMPVIADLFSVTPDQEREVNFEMLFQDSKSPKKEDSRRLLSISQTRHSGLPSNRLSTQGSDTRKVFNHSNSVPPQVPPRTPHPYKVVHGGRSSRPLLDKFLADDGLFNHYKSLLNGYHGWCPRETEYTVIKTFSSVLTTDGYFMIWYMRSKRRLTLSISYTGDLCHYRIRTTVLNDKLHYYIYSNQLHENIIHLLQECKRNGLQSPLEPGSTVRRLSSSSDLSMTVPKFANIFMICPVRVDYGPRTPTSV